MMNTMLRSGNSLHPTLPGLGMYTSSIPTNFSSKSWDNDAENVNNFVRVCENFTGIFVVYLLLQTSLHLSLLRILNIVKDFKHSLDNVKIHYHKQQ